jgi:hypothetical protein
MATYTVTLTDAQDKALSFAAQSQANWIQNAVNARCQIAIDEIKSIALEKSIATNTALPTTEDAIIELAFTNGWVQSMASILPKTGS